MGQLISLNNQIIDFDGLREQLEAHLANKEAWKGIETTQTGQTLLEFIAAVGALTQVKLLRYHQDAFPFTAMNDEAVYAIASMQGVRLNRKLPMNVVVKMRATTGTLAIPELTQFNIAGSKFFNRAALEVTDTDQFFTLFEGELIEVVANGLGTDYQTFQSEESEFTVSDVDVRVTLNGKEIEKTLEGVWLLKEKEGYRDRTQPNGRMLLEFGNAIYGSRPMPNDVVRIRYAVTTGLDASSIKTANKKVKCEAYPDLVGSAIANPKGGGSEKPAELYRNISAPSFGTFGSAVTKSQYLATMLAYPGVVDGKCFAQREINPTAVEWMNMIKLVVLPVTPWGDSDRETFLAYMQSKCMFSSRFFIEEPVPHHLSLRVDLFCHTWANPRQCKQDAEEALRAFFAPQQGILGYDVHLSDIHNVVLQSNKGIEYIKIPYPTRDIIVSGSALPKPTLSFISNIGSGLSAGTYYYGIGVVIDGGEIAPKNFNEITIPENGVVSLFWEAYPEAVSYRVFGRQSNAIGLLTTVPGSFTSWQDTGNTAPDVPPPPISSHVVRYVNLQSLEVNSTFSRRSSNRSAQQ